MGRLKKGDLDTEGLDELGDSAGVVLIQRLSLLMIRRI